MGRKRKHGAAAEAEGDLVSVTLLEAVRVGGKRETRGTCVEVSQEMADSLCARGLASAGGEAPQQPPESPGEPEPPDDRDTPLEVPQE